MAYSIAPEDYDKDLPLFVPIKENRLLNEFFLCLPSYRSVLQVQRQPDFHRLL